VDRAQNKCYHEEEKQKEGSHHPFADLGPPQKMLEGTSLDNQGEFQKKHVERGAARGGKNTSRTINEALKARATQRI